MTRDDSLELAASRVQARRNRLFGRLPEYALNRILRCSTRVWLVEDVLLSSPDAPMQQVYFPEAGVISVAIRAGRRRATHVGLYGCEGFSNVASALRRPTSIFTEVVQVAGHAQCIAVQDWNELLSSMPEMDGFFRSYMHMFIIQIAEGVAAANCSVEQRLARYLLMLQDRTLNGNLLLTHQRLAELLGVRRAGVTDAVHLLEERRLIHARRGIIRILDRPQLQALTAGCYGGARVEYQQPVDA